MKAKFALALTLFSAILISGCQSLGHLYPVQGPLASLTPPPIYTFSLTFPGSPKSDRDQNGIFSMVLPNGEVFKGPWKMTYEKAAKLSATAGVPESSTMAAPWDTVYGQGFYVAHVLGEPYSAHATLTGSQGTILQVEWYEPEFSGVTIVGTKGVAQDSNGNIYKLVM